MRKCENTNYEFSESGRILTLLVAFEWSGDVNEHLGEPRSEKLAQRRSDAVRCRLTRIGGFVLRFACFSLCLVACSRPPERSIDGAPVATAAAPAPASEPASVREYKPTWGDSSGREGKGGTKLTVGADGKLPLFAAGFDKSKRGDAATAKRAEWLLFHGPEADSLGIEWTWVTRGDEKFFGQLWAGGGLAFNDSWVATDATDAKYLVLWVKATQPGANLTLRLHSALKTKGSEDTGELVLARFVSGGRLDESWKRAIIPLSAFPGIDGVELKGLQQVMFNVRAEPPENQKVAVYIDNVYLTNAELVTPVANLGYLATAEGLELVVGQGRFGKTR